MNEPVRQQLLKSAKEKLSGIDFDQISQEVYEAILLEIIEEAFIEGLSFNLLC